MTQNALYTLMIAGLFNNQILTYVSHDNGAMNGCLVLMYAGDILGQTVLSLLFTWIDPHYPDIHKDFIDIATEKAKELGADKLSFQTNRNEKVVDRKMGKYGFNKTFSVYEKKIKEVI